MGSKKPIGKGLDGMFTDPVVTSKKNEEKPKEKLFCPIDADLKIRVNLHKVKNKVTLTDIVEAALIQYLDKEEKK